MRGHLTDREMTAHALGLLEQEALAHLMGCQDCQTECARLRAAIVDFAVQAHAQAKRADVFFQTQRAQIIRRLEERRVRGGRWRIVWAPALAAAALLIIFLTRGGPPPPSPQASETDQVFLTTLERAIYTEVPGALRPVTVLIAEVERGLDRDTSTPKGGQR